MAEEEIVLKENKKVTTKKSNLFNDFMDLLESVIFTIFIVTVVFTFLFRLARVDGSSMNDTLENEDRLVITHLFYQPKRGDIVIVDNEFSTLLDENGDLYKGPGIPTENDDGKILVKRVVAVAGDELDFDYLHNRVFVNGEEIDEPYIREPMVKTGAVNAFDYPLTIPEGYVFVMGDNRNESKDSRNKEVGLVPVDHIMGKVIFRIFPFPKVGVVK